MYIHFRTVDILDIWRQKNNPVVGLFFKVGLVFREHASEVRKVETNYASEHRQDGVNRQGLADTAEDFAKATTRLREDLHHQGNRWVEDEVVLQTEVGYGNYIADDNR